MSNEPEPQSDLFQDAKHVRHDAMQLKRALRLGWPIKNKKAIIERLMKVVEKESVPILTNNGVFECESVADRNAIAAIDSLLAMEKQNIELEQKPIPQQHIHLHGNATQLKPQDADPDYIEFLRQRAIQDHSNAGTVCPVSEQRAMEDVQTPRHD